MTSSITMADLVYDDQARNPAGGYGAQGILLSTKMFGRGLEER